MEKQFDITTVGMSNINVAVAPVDESLFSRDVTVVGPMTITVGGDAANEAITAARLGNSVAFVGKVGNDLFGKHIFEVFRENGISDKYIVVDECATAVGLMLIKEDGNRVICSNRSSFETLSLEDIDLYPIRNSSCVNIGSMFGLKMLDGEGVCRLFREAKEHGAITSADVKQDVYRIGLDTVKPCFHYMDYFLPSYDEALYLTGERDVGRQADFLLGLGCGTVVIKLGEKGCFLQERGKSGLIIPSCPSKAVDTSGAGDNFVAGFLTGICRRWDLEECARFANATASISIQAYGSNGAVKSFEQILDYRREKQY